MSTVEKIAAVIKKNGKLLFTDEIDRKGFLLMPGGKIQPGETHEACLKRELGEELKAEPTLMKFIRTSEGEFKGIQHKVHFYEVELDREPIPSAEVKNLMWLSREDLLKDSTPLIPDFKSITLPDLMKRRLI